MLKKRYTIRFSYLWILIKTIDDHISCNRFLPDYCFISLSARRSYAYVTAVQRQTEEDSNEDLKMKGSPMMLKKCSEMESKARLQGTKSESDLVRIEILLLIALRLF